MLESPKVERATVHELAMSTEVLEHVDMLNENLESLRRRMARLAATMK